MYCFLTIPYRSLCLPVLAACPSVDDVISVLPPSATSSAHAVFCSQAPTQVPLARARSAGLDAATHRFQIQQPRPRGAASRDWYNCMGGPSTPSPAGHALRRHRSQRRSPCIISARLLRQAINTPPNRARASSVKVDPDRSRLALRSLEQRPTPTTPTAVPSARLAVGVRLRHRPSTAGARRRWACSSRAFPSRHACRVQLPPSPLARVAHDRVGSFSSDTLVP